MPWGAIVRSPVFVDVLDAELCRIARVQVRCIKVWRQSSDEPWFDELCRAAFRHKQVAYPHYWKSFQTADNKALFRQSKREANASYANTYARYKAKCREKLDSGSSA